MIEEETKRETHRQKEREREREKKKQEKGWEILACMQATCSNIRYLYTLVSLLFFLLSLNIITTYIYTSACALFYSFVAYYNYVCERKHIIVNIYVVRLESKFELECVRACVCARERKWARKC